MSPERMVEWVNMIWEDAEAANQYMWCNVLAMEVGRYVVGWAQARATGDASLVKVYNEAIDQVYRAINCGWGGTSMSKRKSHPSYATMVVILEVLRVTGPANLPMPDAASTDHNEKLLELIRAGQRLQATELSKAQGLHLAAPLGELGHQAGIASAELYRQRGHQLTRLLRQARVQADGGHDWDAWKEAVDDLLP